MPLKVTILYGSVRRDREGIRLARYIVNKVTERGHEPTLIDPMVDQLPLLDRMYKEYEKGEAPEVMERLAGVIREADGFIVVSGEYNHGIPPALKNLLDHYLEEWFYRPSGIASYSAGGYGGVRAAMQLRMTLAELGMSSIPTVFAVPRVQKTFEEDGTPLDEKIDGRVGRFLAELEWYMEALRAQRAKGLPG